MATAPRVDRVTILGLGLLLMPLTTMWHEIGGHAATCAALGGRVSELGAFYVECKGLGRAGDVAVALAGVIADMIAALVVFQAWRRARGDLWRASLWLVWLGKALVAAGYFCFSGAIGIGDLGPGAGGGIGPLPLPWAWRAAELAIGIALYVWLVRKGMATLAAMIGNGLETRGARRGIAHVSYLAVGLAAVVVGLFNPVGFGITLGSAAASSFGGLAGLISIGYATRGEGEPRPLAVARNWPVLIAGVAATALFAAILGPTLHPA